MAIQLGEAGATVYFTGRTLKSLNGLGSLEDTAAEIRARGGKCVPVQVDHEDDKQIFELFEQIKREQDGQLDILVNNAYKGVTVLKLKLYFILAYIYKISFKSNLSLFLKMLH